MDGNEFKGNVEPVEATPVEPIVAEAVPVEPVVAEAVPVEPVAAEAVPVEPVVAEAVPVEPVVATAVPVEPVVAEAAQVEPVVAEAMPVEPVAVEPVQPQAAQAFNFCRKCGQPLQEGQEFCPHCMQMVATTVQPAAAMMPPVEIVDAAEDGKKKKKKPKTGLIVLFVILGIIILLFVWMFYRSGWSFSQMGKMISEGHISCFIKHDLEDPNCQHGYYCPTCGYDHGDLGDHEWKDATCTEPKTCGACQLTEGAPLGHAVGVGTCPVCGEFSKELWSEYTSIGNYLSKALEEINSSIKYLKLANSSYYYTYTYLYLARSYLSSAQSYLLDAAEVCGSYSDFAEVKQLLLDGANALNTTSSYVSTLAQGGADCCEYISEAATKLKEMAE